MYWPCSLPLRSKAAVRNPTLGKVAEQVGVWEFGKEIIRSEVKIVLARDLKFTDEEGPVPASPAAC